MLSEFMIRVMSDPPRAHAELVRHFSKLKTRVAVAQKLGIQCNTLDRHVARLVRLGFDDPREVARKEAENRGLEPPRKFGLKAVTPEQEREIRRRRRHETIEQVAQVMGLSAAAVSRHSKKSAGSR